jgi:hypothetical protein
MENVTYYSKCFWRDASFLPIGRKSPCVAEGEEKARYPQGLDD